MFNMSKQLQIAGRIFKSRLFLGTGKFSSEDVMKKSILASGTEMVTAAIRRVDFENNKDPFIKSIDTTAMVFLPNTSGARNADEAVRIAKIARFSGISDWVKLEVTPEPNYLLPDAAETLRAAEILVKEGFTVLPYIPADPVLAKRLEEVGCATVMPLASPIGTNGGLKTFDLIQIIIEQCTIPVVVDAGIGSPSDAAQAMEMGADAVLVNTAIATAGDPVAMAEAFKLGVMAGRQGFEAGIPGQQRAAVASSPLTGFLSQ
ncbi:MAG: thiazole synthase [Candidatus Marinamargulisbacteria bacterium]|jgi:thiazole synthase